MSLKIEAKWSKPIQLELAGPGSGEIYQSKFLETIPEEGGIYVFGRTHGKTTHALYIGQAINLRKRLGQQFNSVVLMTKIRDAQNGRRFLNYASPKLKPKQKLKNVITIMENALIAHALSDGIELLQKMGTKRPNHAIHYYGNKTSKLIAPRLMRVGL